MEKSLTGCACSMQCLSDKLPMGRKFLPYIHVVSIFFLQKDSISLSKTLDKQNKNEDSQF